MENKLKLNLVLNHKDPTIGADYFLYLVNAKELSVYLKTNLKADKIDYNKFNSDYQEAKEEKELWGEAKKEAALRKSPPEEIYQYQNFFLLEKDGKYVLLDGFRRLLWYNAPDVQIYVRVYRDLSNSQIFTLMMYLNHFKFFGGGNYHERGFALLLNTVFKLNINLYREAFNAYLSSNEILSSYSYDNKTRTEHNITIKERIVTSTFVSDLTFLEELHNAGAMVNKFMGALTFLERQKSTKEFSSKEFLALSDNPVLKTLLVRFAKVGTSNSSDSQKVVNPIIEIYQNIFAQMRGEKKEKGYAELKTDAKALSETIKKEKGFMKLTGSRDYHKVERVLLKRAREKKETIFKCVVFPEDADKDLLIPSGLLQEKIQIKITKRDSWAGGYDTNYVFEFKSHAFKIEHNYQGKKCTRLYGYPVKGENTFSATHRYPIDLYADITKEEIEAA